MKTHCIHFGLIIVSMFLFSQSAFAQKTLPKKEEVNYTAVKLTPKETNAILEQGESPKLNRQISASGYKAATTTTATKYVGTDSIGAFEIVVIEQSYAPTTLKDKSEIGSYFYQAKRGATTLKTRQVAFDKNTEYRAGAQTLEKVAIPSAVNGNALSNCFGRFITSWSSCSSVGNSIKTCLNGCPKNNRGKPKFGCAVGCVLSNAKQFKNCITNVVALTNCVIDNW